MNKAVRKEPKWRFPVGEGANRVLAGAVGSFCHALRSGTCFPAAEVERVLHVRHTQLPFHSFIRLNEFIAYHNIPITVHQLIIQHDMKSDCDGEIT